MGLALLHETDILPAGAVPSGHTKPANTLNFSALFFN